tara:strand:- start:104181 stop:104792 length:612 start_codon:yes stop_codon:yes gene_type:complete
VKTNEHRKCSDTWQPIGEVDMKVILTDFVPNLGDYGDEVVVADGYARNYLVPNNLALEATPANNRTFENNLKQRARKITKITSEAEAKKGQLESIGDLIFTRKSGDEGKLFGSVTNGDIEAALSAKGFVIDRRKIVLSGPIKSIGQHDVTVKIFKEVVGTIKVVVNDDKVDELVPEAIDAPSEDSGEVTTTDDTSKDGPAEAQ